MRLIIIIFCLATSFVSFAKKAVLFYTDERPPYEYRDSLGQVGGVVPDRVACAMDLIGASYRFVIVPWERAQRGVANGGADAFFAASKNDKRDKYAVFSEIVVEQYWNWYFLKGTYVNPKASNFREEVTVASWYGSNSLRWLVKNGYNVRGKPPLPLNLVQMLRSRRVVVIFGSNLVIEEQLLKSGLLPQVKIVREIYKPMGVYFSKLFLRRNPGFLEKFNVSIRKCIQ